MSRKIWTLLSRIVERPWGTCTLFHGAVRRKTEFPGNLITGVPNSLGNAAYSRAVQHTRTSRDADGTDGLAIPVKDRRSNAAQSFFNLFVIDGEAASTHLV